MKNLFIILAVLCSITLSAQETKLLVRQTQDLGVGANSRANFIAGQSGSANTVLEFIAENMLVATGTFAGQTVDAALNAVNTAAGAQTLSIATDLLAISGGNNVDLTPYLDNTDAQAISLATNILSITGNASTVDLSSYVNNDTNELQTVSTTGNTATLSGNSSTFSFKPQRGTFTFPLTGSEVTSHVISGVVITADDVIKLTRNGLLQDETVDVTLTNDGTDTTVTWNFVGLSTQAGIDDSLVKLFYFVN